MLMYLVFSLCSYPRIFFLLILTKMNIKDILKGQPVGCLYKWSGVLAVDFWNQKVEMSPVLPAVSRHQYSSASSIGMNCGTFGRSLCVVPRLFFHYSLEGETVVKVDRFSKQA